MKRLLLQLVRLLGLLGLIQAAVAAPLGEESPPMATTTPDLSFEYGVDFISSADAPSDTLRYDNGVSTGAGWNRWPLYWYYVETSEGVFNWAYADQVVTDDQARGFKTELILMGTPGFHATSSGAPSMPTADPSPLGWRGWAADPLAPTSPGSVPEGLYSAVFSDGTDLPGAGKGINSGNVWARFIYNVVAHYAPLGITHWEVWNEPDLAFFWGGSPTDYARLLKVAYLAGKHADAGAQIIFGGLANYEQPTFLADVLDVYAGDGHPLAGSGFFDIFATHSYFYAWESWYHVWRADRTMDTHGLSKAIWLNESGAPAWDDYPGPMWIPNADFRSTMAEGAAYVIQSALYAKYAGADVTFHFQLYDDCGNLPEGTDFPYFPDGQHCKYLGGDYDPCAGDAFGLYRNPTDAACYTYHPQPETPRPVYDAFRVLTERGRELVPLWRERPGGTTPYNGPQEWIAFYRPSTGERVLGLWARDGGTYTAEVTATGTAGVRIDQAGVTTPLTPSNGMYSITLEPATNQTHPYHPGEYMIGGPPVILVETDTLPPEVAAQVPTPVSPPNIPVTWSGEDWGTGMAGYDIWVRVNGGPLTPWIEDTLDTSAVYSALPGSTVAFVVTGRDRAGNAGDSPQVTTTVATELINLPFIVH